MRYTDILDSVDSKNQVNVEFKIIDVLKGNYFATILTLFRDDNRTSCDHHFSREDFPVNTEFLFALSSNDPKKVLRFDDSYFRIEDEMLISQKYNANLEKWVEDVIPLTEIEQLIEKDVSLPSAPVPENGYVPDAKTAVKIAEAVLSPIYGERHIKSQRPFWATLKEDTWLVQGTLYCSDNFFDFITEVVFFWKKKCQGGTAEVEISRESGKILRHIHYR